MHLNRLRVGEIVAAVGAALLVVSLFLDWVKPEYQLLGRGRRVYEYPDAGTALAGFDAAGWLMIVLLLIVAALAITLVVLTVTLEPVGMTVASAVGTAFFGILITLVLIVRLTLAQPDLGLGDKNADLQLGAYLSLLGVALCAAGGWLTLRDERMDAPYSVAPVLEPRPAPPVA